MTERAPKRKAKRTNRIKKTLNAPKGNKKGTLSEGEKRFGREYLKDFNGKQAAIRAGYSENGAEVQAHRMLMRPNLAEYISQLAQKREEKLDLSAERTLKELARIAFFDPREVVDWITHQVGSVDLPNPDNPDDGEAVHVELAQTQVTLRDAKSLSDDAAAAISEVSQGRDGTIKIKFHSKPQALNLLARHHGLIRDRVELTVKHQLENLTEDGLDELERRLNERVRSEALEGHVVEGTAQEIVRERPREIRAPSETV